MGGYYSDIMNRLEQLQDSGEIDEFTRRAIIDMTKEVTRHLAEHFTNVKEGVEAIMGGKILNYEAKDILNRGRNEGRVEGRAEGRAESLTQVVINMLKEATLTKSFRATPEPAERKFFALRRNPDSLTNNPQNCRLN